MTDLRDLLDTVAGRSTTPTPDVVAADARRGRRALLRRRSARAGAGLVLAGAAVAVGVAVVPHVGGAGTTGRTVVSAADQPGSAGVALVPFDAGAAPKPISPALVPQGWTVSGSDGGAALVIGRPGVTTSPDDFQGKLVAMLAGDSTASAKARAVVVAGRKGTLSVEGGTTILLYPLADGRSADVQAPASLHWDEATLVRFAEGLTFSPEAPVSRG